MREKKIIEKDIKMREKYGGKVYDGRKRNEITGEKEGWILSAGDRIQYFVDNNINSDRLLPEIETIIIEIGDEYEIQCRKSTVPITVEAAFQPPFFNTAIVVKFYSKVFL